MSSRPSQNFAAALGALHTRRNTPLPPALLGVPSPQYDPATSPFKDIPIGPEPATILLADKSVNIYVLFSTVLARGGAAALTNNNAWNIILPQLGLPEHHSAPDGSLVSVSQLVQHYYSLIFLPFEELYRRNVRDKSQTMRQTTASAPPTMARPPFAGSIEVPEGDQESMKRKLEFEESGGKRARQRTTGDAFDAGFPAVTDPAPVGSTNSVPSSSAAMAAQPRPRHEPSRRKIEYVPLAREVDSYGGRDFRILDKEPMRQWRDLADWGVLDIDALTMSIRSRISTELSYSLTAFALLSTMKGPTPDTGFRIMDCPELLDEVLDLLEDTAFPDQEDTVFDEDLPVVTHRDLVNHIIDLETDPFAALHPLPQLPKDSNPAPRQRPGSVIITVLNILRNLCIFPDNAEYVAKYHSRVLSVLLRLCGATRKGDTILTPSPVILLNDLVVIRKDTLHVLFCTGPHLQFPDPASPPKTPFRVAHRIFNLVASFLVDPNEAVSPFATVQLVGAPVGTYSLKPPSLPDMALEVFTRIGHSDGNRHVFSKAVSSTSLYTLFVSLVHRLPVIDADFQLLSREPWLCFMEKVVMALYTLAFLSPPDLKEKLKSDRTLGAKNVILRMVQKLSVLNSPEFRSYYIVTVRRAIETMKVLDDAKDSFDTSATAVTTISFGMGYGEVGENDVEKGTGLLGGYKDSTWDMLMLRELNIDDTLFAELDSLTRVEY
ncbi:hypothetical protein D9758_000135 [Tetrapyrgos nigripes]|uniref:ARID domain-containing protein n=1 Tax=Tetrapyrgos nigripes TaxID=182062 RepID=A0A8H5LZB2_9AGAR|nr:hypothetical protein D9758_000135 [Tetrapyrgos nigripes]